MGNYRFRFSDMMPNAWFYKLKDMNRARKKHYNSTKKKHPSSSSSTSLKPQKSSQPPAYSHYFNTAKPDYSFYNHPRASLHHFHDPPRRSSKKRTQRKTIYKPSPKLVPSSAVSSNGCQVSLNSVLVESSSTQDSSDYSLSPLETSPEPHRLPESLLSDSDEDENNFALPQSFDQLASSWSSSCNCKVSSSNTDIIIDMNNDSCNKKLFEKDGLEPIYEIELPPVVTKPAKMNGRKSPKWNSPGRKSPINTNGIRLRANSPRIANKKIQACARRSVSSSNTCLNSKNKTISDSFAVEKSSVDPQRDFRESMVEMIVGNNIRTSKDLEDLLACYLSLNSTEYHDLIVKAFEQIWFDMTNLRL